MDPTRPPMANRVTTTSSTDLEKAEEKPRRDSSESSTSTFSWHHAEGPRSIRAPSVRRGNSTSNMSRTTSRLEQVESVAESALARIRSRVPRAPFSHPLTIEKTGSEVVVDFEGPDDPYRPLNWPLKKKLITTTIYGFTSMTSSFASSIISPGVSQVAEDFHVGNEVATLGIALLIFGFGLGPLMWGPLSELYGRKKAVLGPVFISALFSFGRGASNNIQSFCILSFFIGLFGAAPITNTGGVLADLFTSKQRGLAIVGYSFAVVGGPTLGPVVGGAICISYLRWRWTQYITGIFQMLMVVLGVVFVDESYPAALLVTKASRLRHESGNWALHAKHEEWDANISEFVHKYLVRPFQLLSTPICALMAFYASFCYGLIYGCLAAFPIIFEQERGWNKLVGSLPFLALLIGILLACITNIFNQKLYLRKLEQNNGRAVPEARLYAMMIGGPFLTGGIFMLAWTATKSVFWFVPCVAIALIGYGFFLIFQAAINYLVDTFQRYSASAVAANTFTRSCLAGAFPLFMGYQLDGIGIGWGLSVFGFVSAVLMPVPYFFYFYGKRIRGMSKWSRESL